jgi:hypothetical protein
MRSWDFLPALPLVDGALAERFRALALADFRDAARWVHELPYGRNSDRADYRSVLSERCGTCSTKHALLAALAGEQGFDVELRLGLYEMNARNTPGVGAVLAAARLEAVPEAHCYLAHRGERVDVTRAGVDPAEEITILVEERIAPSQIGAYKVRWHEARLRDWAGRRAPPLDWRELWRVREGCIAALAQTER